MNKQTRSLAAWISVALLLVTACAPSAAPSAPAASAPGAAPAAASKGAEWDRLVAAAKQEGELVLNGPPFPDLREALNNSFTKEYGIRVNFNGASGSEHLAKLKSERAAEKYAVDVSLNGAPNLYSAREEGVIAPLRDKLILPEVTDPSKWQEGKMWWVDPEQQRYLRIGWYAISALVVNTSLVDPKTFTTWDEVLNPKYQGKITSPTPTRPGPGGGAASYLWLALGEEKFKRLYADQKVVFTDEVRQAAEWVARGVYPIGVGIDAPAIEPFRQQGLPMQVISPPDAPGYLSSGWATLVLIDRAPHPNAAQLFINWAASKEGNEIINRAIDQRSLRADVTNDWAPDYTAPQPGATYVDTHAHDYLTTTRQKADAGVKAALGAK